MKRSFVAFVAAAMFILPAGFAAAQNVANGELKFHGGQTDTIVYSEIVDAKPNNSKKYMVHASVKVCTEIYRSGWKKDYAYKSADREWYCNESAYYDYYQR